jgi:hypothetical protein
MVTAPTGSTAAAGSTAATESGTGALCVPAQTSLSLALTTGLEFTDGQNVVLANQPVTTTPADTTTPGTTTPGTTTPAATAAATTTPLFFHLRGFLVIPGA